MRQVLPPDTHVWAVFAIHDLLGGPAGRDGVAHALDIGTRDAVCPQLAEQRAEDILECADAQLCASKIFVAERRDS